MTRACLQDADLKVREQFHSLLNGCDDFSQTKTFKVIGTQNNRSKAKLQRWYY
jgi:hypothetical protein